MNCFFKFFNPNSFNFILFTNKIITQRNLFFISALFIVITLVLVITTYLLLAKKKKIFFFKKDIRKQLDNWISEVLILEEKDSDEAKTTTNNLMQLQSNKIAQEFILSELLSIKKSFSGSASINIVTLYEQLGLKELSLNKLNQSNWLLKAKGIQELHIMDQKEVIPIIETFINNENEFIRMEAHTALIHLKGFDGLHFLNNLDYTITEWQQIKLLNQLSLVTYQLPKDLQKWLKSGNDSVVNFALKLIDVYQIFEVYDDVEKCLQHENEQTRNFAINALYRIAKVKTGDIMIKYFKEESLQNQINILKKLAEVGSANHAPFFLALQNHSDDEIKIEAAKTLTKCSYYGLAALETRGILQPNPYQKIFNHVLAEV